MLKRKTTTIVFEGSDIRCLVLQGGGVKSWRSVEVSPEMMTQGIIHQPNAVGQKVHQLVKSLGGSTRRVLSSVTDQRSVHRIMTIPDIKESLLDEAILRKAKQEFAIPIEETDLTWRIIHRRSNQIYLYVLAIPKLVIDQQVAALRAAKIKPRVLDAKPLALIRAASTATALIINLEPSSMSVIIVVNQIPMIVRTIPLDSGALSDEFRLDLLSQELARTTKYYNESNKKNRLAEDTPLFVSGKLFDVPALEARLGDQIPLVRRLQERTPYPIRSLQPPPGFPGQLPVGEYGVNLGLASRKA